MFPLPLEHKKAFKDKRRVHYNEYSKVKLARKLIEQELKDLEDDNDGSLDSAKEGSSSTDACAADTQVIYWAFNYLVLNQPFTPHDQYPHSPYPSQYIFFGTEKENLLKNQSFLVWWSFPSLSCF